MLLDVFQSIYFVVENIKGTVTWKMLIIWLPTALGSLNKSLPVRLRIIWNAVGDDGWYCLICSETSHCSSSSSLGCNTDSSSLAFPSLAVWTDWWSRHWRKPLLATELYSIFTENLNSENDSYLCPGPLMVKLRPHQSTSVAFRCFLWLNAGPGFYEREN